MSNASKPDGTDPRVLQPEGEEVKIVKSSHQSSSRAYHKPDCRIVEQMDYEPVTVDIAVAEFKNCTPCHRCYGDGREAVTARDVARWRRRLVDGESSSEVAADVGYSDRTVREHATGAIEHDDIAVPPLEHTTGNNNGEWQFVEDTNGDD